MKRFMISLAALGLVFVMSDMAQAKGKSGSSGSKGSSKSTSTSKNGNHSMSWKKDHDHDKGKKHYDHDKGHFLKGDYHCYRGRHCDFWNYHCWDRRYGCELYWNPWYRCYYYYCDPDDCYYPISYCPHRKFSFVTETPVVQPSSVTVIVQPGVVTETAAPVGPAPVPAP
jgi:Ni/Co efflux regulator RcnB